MDRLQAAMAVIEGYSEHVMDALGERADPRPTSAARRRWTRRRHSRSAPERVLERLLGLDLKLRQYELGKAFCDAVVAAGRHRGPEPRLGARRRCRRARAAPPGAWLEPRGPAGRRLSRRPLSLAARTPSRRRSLRVTRRPRRFTNMCSVVYFY